MVTFVLFLATFLAIVQKMKICLYQMYTALPITQYGCNTMQYNVLANLLLIVM